MLESSLTTLHTSTSISLPSSIVTFTLSIPFAMSPTGSLIVPPGFLTSLAKAWVPTVSTSHATTEGIKRSPSAFAMISGSNEGFKMDIVLFVEPRWRPNKTGGVDIVVRVSGNVSREEKEKKKRNKQKREIVRVLRQENTKTKLIDYENL